MAEIGETVLIDAVYEAALAPSQWPHLLERIADAVGGASAALIRQNQLDRRGEAVISRLDPAVAQTYFSTFAKSHGHREANDPRARIRRFVPRIVCNDDQYPVLARTELYSDFMRPLDMHTVVRVGLDAEHLDASLVAFTRPERWGGFDAERLALLARLHPHLIRAYRLGRVLAAERGLDDDLAEVFDRSRQGLALLTPDGLVRRLNAAAVALTTGGDGLTVVSGRLVAARPRDTARLDALIGAAGSPDDERRAGGSTVIERPSGRAALAVTVTPLRSERVSIFAPPPSVIVSVNELDGDMGLSAEQLRELFALTPAEIRVALCVFDGLSPREAAAHLGLSFNTVRFHLANVMAKTGVSRQAQLVRLMAKATGVLPN